MELHEALAARVREWRDAGYAHERYPAIAEILGFAIDGDGPQAPLRYLRAAQLRALETYWYLRLVQRTPRIEALYRDLFAGNSERLAALGLDKAALKDLALDLGYDGLLDRIRTDDALVREHRLDAQRETLTLDYPSWILALAMGAGKTVLIGAIVATEFAMALEYPEAADDDTPFIENALVFAPGTTIIESLRELAGIPYERILPPRFHDRFAASVKITFTRDGERDIPVIRGSRFNLVVTNTEKIRIQSSTRRAGNGLGQLLRLLESGKLFESELGVGAGGEGPGGQLTLDSPPPSSRPDADESVTGDAAERAGETSPTPPAPASPRRGGSGPGNRSGVGEVVIRSLDPRLRSAMVVEDGVRRVVINSRYPLYEVRKGDLWYQLETALREVCVTIPEATVPEFERKVNELMLVSLSLAARRKRRPARRKDSAPTLL